MCFNVRKLRTLNNRFAVNSGVGVTRRDTALVKSKAMSQSENILLAILEGEDHFCSRFTTFRHTRSS